MADKRRTWREEEQRLIERWNSAAERYRVVQAEVSLLNGSVLPDDLKLREQTARAEVAAVRREVAKLKVEFNSGKRY